MRDWWKYTATASIAALSVMLGGFFAVRADWVTRGEVREMIANDAPYNRDRELIATQQKRMQDDLQRLADQVSNLVRMQADISGELRQLIRQLESNAREAQ